MELIRQNPYHVVGIFAGDNQRTISKQKAKINAFQKVGKSIEFDADLDFTGNPDRSDDALEKAFANIEINQNKLFNGLFWFTNNNHLDETALTYLQSGDLEKAEDIWQKITNGKEISSKNFSAINNLGTLKLATSFLNGSINSESLKEGIRLKTDLITSDSFKNFCYLVADETYTVEPEKELETFINALLENTNKLKVSEANKIPAIIGSVHPKLKSIVSSKLTNTPLHNIERKIEQTRKKRPENPSEGLNLAKKLYRDTKSDLNILTNILEKSDLKYNVLADKLAKELLQCGIDYFKEYQDREDEHSIEGIPNFRSQYGRDLASQDLGSTVMNLFKTAKNIAVGTQAKDRISENIEGLQEWIDNAQERNKQKLISKDFEFVAIKLEQFQRLPDTIGSTENLVNSCTPKLKNMKSVLGASDKLYLKISSAVVNNAQGMLVSVINDAQNDHLIQLGIIDGLKGKIWDAINVSKKLGTLDMEAELRAHYTKNHETLVSIATQLGISSTDSNSTKKASVSTNKTENYSATSNSSSSNSQNNAFSSYWPFILLGLGALIGSVNAGFGGLIGGLFMSFFAIGIIQWFIELFD